jgi:hypothetical protein
LVLGVFFLNKTFLIAQVILFHITNPLGFNESPPLSFAKMKRLLIVILWLMALALIGAFLFYSARLTQIFFPDTRQPEWAIQHEISEKPGLIEWSGGSLDTGESSSTRASRPTGDLDTVAHSFEKSDRSLADLQALEALIAVRCRENPESVIDTLRQIRDPDLSAYLLAHAMSVIAEQRPYDALVWSRKLAGDNVSLRSSLYVAICKTQAAGADYARVQQWMAQIKEPSDKIEVYTMLIDSWAEKNPKQLISGLMQMEPGRDRDDLIARTAMLWGQTQPEDASTFAASLPAGSVRMYAIENAIGSWAHSDLPAVAEWLNSLGEDRDVDMAVSRLVSATNFEEMGAESIPVMWEWTQSIEQSQIYFDTVLDILRRLKESDASLVRRYLDDASARLSAEDYERLKSEVELP